MRRRDAIEDKDAIQRDEKSNENKPKNMKLSRLKIGFTLILIIAVLMYIYLHFGIKKPGLPVFPLPPEFQAIYEKYGEGEAKPRRRPELKTNDDIKDRNNENSEDKKETVVDSVKNFERAGKDLEGERKEAKSESLHVAIVACGDRAPEAIISLKSFAMFSRQNLHFHVFAEDKLHKEFRGKIEKWPKFINGSIKLDIHPISFPGSDNFDQWKSLFKPCASQRLFLPLLLTKVDSVIYVDTDVLMLRPADDLWKMFNNFNNSQLAGLAPEGEVDAIGWYNRFARHPYYGRLGVNSGVMLMNLTRMRSVNWNKDIMPIYRRYKYDITWGDQCILNIMFHFKPEQLYVFTCDWNYRPDHCMYGNNCEAAMKRGISVVHGNRRVFHNAKQPEFKVIYDAFEEYDFEKDSKRDLKVKIDRNMEKYKMTYCGENRHLFTLLLGNNE